MEPREGIGIDRDEINQTVGKKVIERLQNYHSFSNTPLPPTHAVHSTNVSKFTKFWVF